MLLETPKADYALGESFSTVSLVSVHFELGVRSPKNLTPILAPASLTVGRNIA